VGSLQFLSIFCYSIVGLNATFVIVRLLIGYFQFSAGPKAVGHSNICSLSSYGGSRGWNQYRHRISCRQSPSPHASCWFGSDYPLAAYPDGSDSAAMDILVSSICVNAALTAPS